MKENRGISRVDEAWKTLSERISKVVVKLLEDRRVSQAQLARELNYAQSSLSDTLNPAKPDRRWSFPLLLLVSEYLDTPVHAIIEAAEKGDEVAWLELYLAKKAPHSMDRLELIVRTCASKEEEKNAQLMHLYYNAQMFENYAPLLVKSYLNGEMKDRDMYDFLHKVKGSLQEGDHLWNGVKQEANK